MPFQWFLIKKNTCNYGDDFDEESGESDSDFDSEKGSDSDCESDRNSKYDITSERNVSVSINTCSP